MVYGQVDPELTDSIDYDDSVLLSETVIVARGLIDLEEDRKTPVASSTISRQEIQDKAVGNVER